MFNIDFSRDLIDLHIHTNISDGTDSPRGLLEKVRSKGIRLFSVTDHDDFKGALAVIKLLRPGDPAFVCGTEFSCKDEFGSYHILGYGYRPWSKYIRELTGFTHSLRMKKVTARLDFLKNEFGFVFPEREIGKLMKLDNPGKPHIALLSVKYGYAKTKEEAIEKYINKLFIEDVYVSPVQAIGLILKSGGIPVLAHPVYGNGDQTILGKELFDRVLRLKNMGLRGLEGYYSGYVPKIRNEVLGIASQLGLYVTAGSDYHGDNKMIGLGDISVGSLGDAPEGLIEFCRDVRKIVP